MEEKIKFKLITNKEMRNVTVEFNGIKNRKLKKRKINGIKADCFKKINETDKPFSQTDQEKKEKEHKLLISGIKEVMSLKSLKILKG